MVYEIFSRHYDVNSLLSILYPQLPHSAPLYYRLQSPQNIPKNTLLAASFPAGSQPTPGNVYTVAFADRSRKGEEQIWMFNSLVTRSFSHGPETSREGNKEVNLEHKLQFRSHMEGLFNFMKSVEMPDSTGWPFDPVIRLACVHELLYHSICSFAPIIDSSAWCHYILYKEPAMLKINHVLECTCIPTGYIIDTVPESTLDWVLSSSAFPRLASTQRQLPNKAALYGSKVVGWIYFDLDFELISAFVLPQHRGKGLAKQMAARLLYDFWKTRDEPLFTQMSSNNTSTIEFCKHLGGLYGWISWEMSIDLDSIEQYM